MCLWSCLKSKNIKSCDQNLILRPKLKREKHKGRSFILTKGPEEYYMSGFSLNQASKHQNDVSSPSSFTKNIKRLKNLKEGT